MDEDLDELCDTFITEINNRIYEKLLDNYPNYRNLIHQKTEFADVLFKDRMKETAKKCSIPDAKDRWAK